MQVSALSLQIYTTNIQYTYTTVGTVIYWHSGVGNDSLEHGTWNI